MAKLGSPYGTSPISSFFNELTHNAFTDDFHQIQPDPFDLFEELPSIYSDIQKIESDTFSPYGSTMDLDLDMKPEIRNTDLMWWTAPPTSVLSTSATSTSSDISTGVSLAAVMGAASPTQQIGRRQIKVEQEDGICTPTVVTAKKVNPIIFKQGHVQIKEEPTDDVEQQLDQHSIPNNKMTTTATAKTTRSQPLLVVQSTGTTTSMQNIPPGTSLLRKSQQQQQKKSTQQTRGSGLPNIIKRGDQLLPHAKAINITSSSSSLLDSPNTTSPNTSLLYRRPDTPHSLDDDCSTPEFRHNVDLRACVMGSNNISLTTDHDFIKTVTQELQDTSKKQIDTRLISSCSLAEVMDVINSSSNSQDFLNFKSTANALTPSTTYSSGSSYHSLNASSSLPSSESDSDEESILGSSSCSLLDHDITSFSTGVVSPASSQMSNIGGTKHYTQHLDHSYTRSKDGMDDLSTNLETPSDSEEEIDVVSINDRKLPTNPSDKDRRVLQTKVAHKFNAARIVTNPSGIRTIPPRRGSYEYPYTPASCSPVKTAGNSRFPSTANTTHQNNYTTKYVQQQQQIMAVVVTDNSTGVPINVLSSSDKSRKRLMANSSSNASNLLTMSANDLSGAITTSTAASQMPPTKKHRGKKTAAAVQLTSAGVLKRHYIVDETADTIEKRNLHNDMERQRRIGLKNLFEALKKQIPSIKDKERAPKVNILREAAKLCEALTRQDQQLMEQKAKLKDELRRKQQLLAQLKAAQHTE